MGDYLRAVLHFPTSRLDFDWLEVAVSLDIDNWDDLNPSATEQPPQE